MYKFLAWTCASLVAISMIIETPLLQARTFDLREQSIYAEAFDGFVKNYVIATREYKLRGPQAFVDSMGLNPSASEKPVLMQALGSLPELPKITSDQALLVIDAMALNAGTHTIEVSNIDEGMLIVDGVPVEIDLSKTNFEALAKKIESSFDRSTTKVSFFEQVDRVLWPQAYAAKRNVVVWSLLGVLGALGVKFAWDKWNSRSEVKPYVYDGIYADKPAAGAANTPAPAQHSGAAPGN